RRRMRVDVDEVAVTRITWMMINVDPNFGGFNRSDGRSEPILNRGVERDDHIDIFRFSRCFREEICLGKKTVFFQHAFLIPNAHILAELFERKPQRQLASEGIAVRPNVAENDEPLMFAQDLADLLE